MEENKKKSNMSSVILVVVICAIVIAIVVALVMFLKKDEIETTADYVEFESGKVEYNVPTTFEASEYNTDTYKYYTMYSDDTDNALGYTTVSVATEGSTTEEYFEYLTAFINEYYPEYYDNVEIAEIEEVKVKNLTYSLLKVSYSYTYESDEQSYTLDYADYYYATQADSDYCYTVEVTDLGNYITDAQLNAFLNATITVE